MNTLRCASFARDEGFDPLGTAGHHRGFLLVDWPLPWPPDLGDVPGLSPVYEALEGTGIRLQGVVPAPGADLRVALYHAGSGEGFAGYRRTERWVAASDVGAAAAELAHAAAVGDPPPAGGRVVGADTARIDGDVLICTHGRRDRCCGASGTALVVALLAHGGIAAAGYRVGRTSHTGGHRFAPTAIVLPEGTMWAFLDADLTSRVVRRSGAVDDVLGAYRGCTGLGPPALQAVERVAFGDVGWEWLDWHRRGEDLGGGRVRLVGEAPDGTRRAWEAVVAERLRPMPDCGRPLDEARKVQVEPLVVAVTRPRPQPP